MSSCQRRSTGKYYDLKLSESYQYNDVCLQLYIYGSIASNYGCNFDVGCRMAERLGAGQFGSVMKAIWNYPGGSREVAAKTMRPTMQEGARVRFLQEAAIMGQFFHPNILKLHGVVTVGEPVS